jgi:predicted amidophosphoribosyltransferase
VGVSAKIADYLDEFSRTWVGWQFPPVVRELADTGWCPDLRAHYCPRCGGSVGPGEVRRNEAGERKTDEPAGCAACKKTSGIADGVVRLGHYDDMLREWVLAVKYRQWAAMGEALGRMLAEQVAHAAVVNLDRTVVVPMPMPWQRRLYRGIDHARVLASGVADELGLPIVRCLAKDNGPPMVSLTRKERVVFAGRGMRVRRRWGGWPLDELDVLLVDDVRTSGASLRRAAKILHALRARRVIAAVVAVADESGRRGLKQLENQQKDVESDGDG